MGQGWRRVSEAVLQRAPTMGLASRQFAHTSNSRNELMFKEATTFAGSIKMLERDLKGILKAIDTQYKNMRGLLVTPLPRIYDFGPNGPIAVEADAGLLGNNMDVEALLRAADVARRRVNIEVVGPMHEWLAGYHGIEERMRKLEALRLELDSRRRTVMNLQGKIERIKADLGTTKHKGMAELKETEDIYERKQEKMMKTEQEFRELENMVYTSLSTLVRDIAVLRDFTHASLTIIQDCFAHAAGAYNTTANPQQSSNNAIVYHNPSGTPGNKYEAQYTGGHNTPKGLIGGMFDRIRGRSKVPESPVQMHQRDATGDPDQIPVYQMQPAYGGLQSQRVTQHQVPQQPQMNYMSARPTAMDMPPDAPNHAAYMQQQQQQPMPGPYGAMPSPHRYQQQPALAAPQGAGGWTQDGY